MNESSDQSLLLALPLPIAQAWRHTLYAVTHEATHERALFTLEAALKYVAAASVATWVERGAAGAAPQKACEALVRPSLGHWASMLRACTDALSPEDPARAWFEQVQAYPVSGSVPGLQVRTVGQALDHLPAYRNTLVHGAGLRPGTAAERAPGLLALAREAAVALVGEKAPVLLGLAGARIVRLVGPTALPADGSGEALKAALVLRMDGRDVPLDPLWLFDPEEDDVLVLNKGAGLKKVEYLSYGVSRGGTGLTVRRGAAADAAARFLERATGRSSLDAAEVADLIEETEVRTLESRATDQRIGPYRVVRRAAKGGQGILYEAIQEEPPRRVALKVLRLQSAVDEAARRRFREEGEALAKVEHPGVVPVYATGDHEGVPWIAMKFVEGKSLAEVLEALRGHAGAVTLLDWNRAASSGGDRPEAESRQPHASRVAGIAAEAARALQACHEAGVVHRDVKPGNLMLDEDGRVLLTDFGLARSTDVRSRTFTRRFVGTLQYAAPEALLPAGKQGPAGRLDVYGLGATLYEALALRRPFAAYEADEGALLHAVQQKEPPLLRKIAPWVPRDLATITAKAMEKDRDRRYATAGDLADDLERYLAGRPIKARPVGPVTRAWKWSKRNPGRAVAMAAAVVVVLGIAGVLIGTKIARERAVQGYLARAETLLREGRFGPARAAIGQAQGLDARSHEAAALEKRVALAEAEARKQAALEAAANAREEARTRSREYGEGVLALAPRRRELAKLRESCMSAYAPTRKRAALARLEQDLAHEEARLERLLAEGREALERAFRLESPHFEGKPGPETRAALAEYFLGRFRERLLAGDRAGAGKQATEVRRWDADRRHEAELLGLGSLTVTVKPEDAAVYLFRYESYETVRRDPPVVPRLVPVPTTGVGRVREGAWVEDFFPGDLCLVVTGVDKDSIAARAGITPGDLVVRLNGRPCGDGLFVETLSPKGPAAAAGVQVLDRIEQLGGEAVEGMYEWKHPLQPVGEEAGTDRSFSLTAGGITVTAARKSRLDRTFGLRPGLPVAIVEGRAPAAMKLTCLREGTAVALEVPAGEQSGLGVEVTAYPLILSLENRVAAGQAIRADPGSYLLLVRRAGCEDQRFAVVVPRKGEAEARVALLAAGTTPPGFVYVPPGPFIYAGDSEAYNAGPEQVVELDGFFIARKELTVEAWFAFVNDTGTLAEIAAKKKEGKTVFLPRDPGTPQGYAKQGLDGKYTPTQRPTTPVLGISWNDIEAYLAWRNRRARAAGERWRYDLPTEQEWEKAARGVDGRYFPWGDRFDHVLTVGLHRKKTRLYSEAGGFEPRDESPYGLFDLGGSRYEWCGNEYAPGSGTYPLRGGAWGYSSEQFFRSALRFAFVPSIVDSYPGFRVVLRSSP